MSREVPLRDVIAQSHNPVDVTQRSRENSETLEQGDGAWRGIVQPAEDKHSTAALHQSQLGLGGIIRIARVVWAVPYLNWYRIQFDTGGVDCPACRMTSESHQPFSMRHAGIIPPGSYVLAMKDPHSYYAVILGCVPDIVSRGALTHAAQIAQASGVGFMRERYYTDMLSLLPGGVGLLDWSSNRPVDSLALGEHAILDDTGGGLFMDSLMKFMRVDESCGLWLHYADRYTRLAGNNMDVVSAIHEATIRNDNGEGLYYRGITPYYWEALGMMHPGTAYQDNAAALRAGDADAADTARCEPLHPDQQPFYRYEELQGYIGQGAQRRMLLPPSTATQRYADAAGALCVFREHIGLHGAWNVETAHSASIVKHTLIPVGKRIRPPEDPQGDDLELRPDEYKPAGQFGTGPEHTGAYGVRIESGEEHPQLRGVAGLGDTIAQQTNWAAVQGEQQHTRDYDTQQQSDVPLDSVQQYCPDYSQLDGVQQLDIPPSQDVTVDHRGSAEYHQSTSGLFMLPDGSIVLQDGYGTQLTLGGGNVRITTPGDIIMESGRSNITYAGDDAIIKARKSVDITASLNDVRLKAERNMDMLSGNCGEGRMLLDNRADGYAYAPQSVEGEDITDPGIILKAAKSQVTTAAGRVHVSATDAAGIVLAATDNDGVVRIDAAELRTFIAEQVQLAIGRGENQVTNTFTPQRTNIGAPLDVSGGVTVGVDGMTVRGDMIVTGGRIYNDQSVDGTIVSVMEGANQFVAANDEVQRVVREQSQDRESATRSHASMLTTYYADSCIGNPVVLAQSEFAPRNDAQLNTTQFQLPRSYWSQLAGNTGPNQWNEPIITYHGQSMQPHPGYQQWHSNATLLTPELTLHDPATGLDVPRQPDGQPYVGVTHGGWTGTTPDGNYPVITPE